MRFDAFLRPTPASELDEMVSVRKDEGDAVHRPVKAGWSDEAREAAAEARRQNAQARTRGEGGGQARLPEPTQKTFSPSDGSRVLKCGGCPYATDAEKRVAKGSGDFTDCMDRIAPKVDPDDPEAFCAWYEHEQTGHWPGEKNKGMCSGPSVEKVGWTDEAREAAAAARSHGYQHDRMESAQRDDGAKVFNHKSGDHRVVVMPSGRWGHETDSNIGPYQASRLGFQQNQGQVVRYGNKAETLSNHLNKFHAAVGKAEILRAVQMAPGDPKASAPQGAVTGKPRPRTREHGQFRNGPTGSLRDGVHISSVHQQLTQQGYEYQGGKKNPKTGTVHSTYEHPETGQTVDVSHDPKTGAVDGVRHNASQDLDPANLTLPQAGDTAGPSAPDMAAPPAGPQGQTPAGKPQVPGAQGAQGADPEVHPADAAAIGQRGWRVQGDKLTHPGAPGHQIQHTPQGWQHVDPSGQKVAQIPHGQLEQHLQQYEDPNATQAGWQGAKKPQPPQQGPQPQRPVNSSGKPARIM